MKFRLTVFTVLALFACALAQAGSIAGVRIWPAPDHTRIVFDLTAPVTHKLFSLAGPDRIVIDLQATKLQASLADLELADSPVSKIRSAKRNRRDLRVVLDLAAQVSPKSFLLKPDGDYGHRLVVDLFSPGGDAVAATKQADAYTSQRDILVVIDPGHGGEDPGAIGPGGVQEKDVVLAISKKLQALLNEEKGFTAQLTRSGDYFLRLRQRNMIARKHNADLLVSIHADAFKRPEASGASVFALSKSGATSETARWLAASENTSDLIGGAGTVSLDDKDDVLAGVLLDLSMTASMKASLNAGDHILGAMGQVARLHKNRVEQAGFVVLKSPDIPSILVETGFISNPEEASRLKTRGYQQKMATAIKRGIQRYFTDDPPPGTLLAWRKHQDSRAAKLTHVIRRGDTLSDIARANNISTQVLMDYNQLNGDMLRIGQVLEIPTT